ncbi:MAG: hypothetical protein QXL82_03520 [Candidatus Aenigmatarchaeota archaeon]
MKKEKKQKSFFSKIIEEFKTAIECCKKGTDMYIESDNDNKKKKKFFDFD